MNPAPAKETCGVAANPESGNPDQLLLDQLPQVRYLAKRIHDRVPKCVPYDDIVSAGILGLLEAVRNFDPSRNAQLRTYAKIRIRGAILDSLRDMDWSPRRLRRAARQIEEAHHQLRSRLGRSPSESEIASELGMTLHELQTLLSDLRGLNLGSLQAVASKDGREDELCNYIPNSPDEDPYHLCLKSEMRRHLARAIGELPDKERKVMALYYVEELTMKEVGAVLGVGEARISQIHSAAVLRLRSRLRDLLAPECVPSSDSQAA